MKKIAVIGIAAFIIHRVVNNTVSTKQAYTSIQVKPRNIKNISLSTSRIKFDTDLDLSNNSEKTISITQGLLSYISRIDFYLDNTYLGFATPTRQDIEIPPYGKFTMRNITVEVPTKNALNILKNNNINVENITVRTHISAAGQNIII